MARGFRLVCCYLRPFFLLFPDLLQVLVVIAIRAQDDIGVVSGSGPIRLQGLVKRVKVGVPTVRQPVNSSRLGVVLSADLLSCPISTGQDFLQLLFHRAQDLRLLPFPLERNRGRFSPSENLFLELKRNEEDP